MAERLFAYLSYVDAPAALRWLRESGFDALRRQDLDGHTVIHAEARLGDAVVMVSSRDAAHEISPLIGQSTGHGLYLRVDDVDSLYSRAVTAGATAVIPPEDTEWGTRRARVVDPEGHEWSFGTYEPGAAW